ncbi:MAG: putative ABC transport system permease protein [Candidatus Nitrosomirales archaeon]|jgi:putative ABC transport system permease protein
MQSKDIIELAFSALKERKTRSILTVVMVVVGSSLMISISGLTGGFTQFTDKQFSALAPNVLFISSAQPLERSSGGFGIGGGGPPASPKVILTSVVANNIKNLPSVADAVANYQGQLTLESKGKSIPIRVFAFDPQKMYVIVPNAEFDEGSVLVSNDPSFLLLAENIARPPGEDFDFAVLGQAVQAKYSFVDESGKQKVNSRSFVVKSILKVTGNPTVDSAGIITLDAANSLMNKGNRYDGVVVTAKSIDLVDEVESEIRTLYGNDIGITSAQFILKTIKEFISGITSFMLSIAVVALLVGAVGIITTLYTSVMERTREIGTMKAIGAQSRDVLSLFLSEAIMIGVIGATVGIVVGIAGGFVLTAAMTGGGEGPSMTAVFFPQDLTMIWFLSVGLSALAGFYPAVKASRMPPIVALRRE